MTGNIVTRTLKDGSKRYHAVFQANGKQRWKTFKKKKQADQFLTSAVKTVHEGSYTHVTPLTMSKVFDEWLEKSLAIREANGTAKYSTAKLYRCVIGKHLRPFFGGVRSDRLHGRDLSTWLAEMAQQIGRGEISYGTASNADVLLRSILKWARLPAQRFLAHDPTIGVERIRVLKKERACPEPDQVEALLNAAPPPTDTVLRLAAFAGLRRAEIFGLQWKDIDLERSRLSIRRAIVLGRVTTPKTPGSVRAVDIPLSLRTELLIYREMCPPIGEGFLFRHPVTGAHLRPSNWDRANLAPLIKRLGLSVMGLHQFRHFYASLLVNSGQVITYVSKQLGHASIGITLNIYSHLFKESGTQAMQQLDRLIPQKPTASSNGDLMESAKPSEKTTYYEAT